MSPHEQSLKGAGVSNRAPFQEMSGKTRNDPPQSDSATSVTAALSEVPSRQRLRLSNTGLGGGVAPEESQDEGSRAERQRHIAEILPVNDVKKMTADHWNDLLALERKYLPLDWCAVDECPVLGVKQSNVNRDHRHRIVKWMGEACSLFKWGSQTFFTAVHAWDFYMAMTSHEVPTGDLAKLSAACLYFGAQLVESAADENVKTLEEFSEMCPEVGNALALCEVQAHLVDTLQGVSLGRRTPMDFLLLYLASLQLAPQPCPKLFEHLLQQNLLDVVWDLALGVSLTIYANGLILDGLPSSRWVAGTIIRLLEFACPALRTDNRTRELIRKYIFHLPVGVLEMHQYTIIDPIIKEVWQHISAAGIPSNSSKPASKRKPYEMIRHSQPAQFPQWTITFPTDRTVQDVSARLRAMSFDTCTPPNVNATGSSISASKRAVVEKPRRAPSTPGNSERQVSGGSKTGTFSKEDEPTIHDVDRIFRDYRKTYTVTPSYPSEVG